MITTTITAELLRGLIAGQPGKLWVCIRSGPGAADAVKAFATDQETALADFLTFEVKGLDDAGWVMIGTAKPTRVDAEFDRLISPNVAAVFLSGKLSQPRSASCSESWAAFLARHR